MCRYSEVIIKLYMLTALHVLISIYNLPLPTRDAIVVIDVINLFCDILLPRHKYNMKTRVWKLVSY